ncbi:DM13 domain-containing protein [Paenibacillus humicola]|uniref:DM13 domain-containing protein n=1 Tax=Paenibacillus humicola TaxID=3110540 RepID=UPI00237C357F|nr:DM13 domain-containing protein [Paenibacillus humicola]
MKKMLFSLTGLIVVLSIVLAACGQSETPASNAASGNSASATTASNSTGSDNASSGDNAGASNASSSDDMMADAASGDNMADAVLTGTFEGQNDMKAAGTAAIENGQLKLSGFSVSEGPDLHIYLAKGDDVADGMEFGKIDLKSADQTFDVSKADLSKYDSVLIYCQKAHVIFGKAALDSKMADHMDNMAADSAKLTGSFEGQNEMKAAGTATIENGQLKLSGFSVSEGPDLHVYLAKGDDAANGMEFGKINLKSADQTFDVSKADLSKYDTVLIYCQKAHVIFGKAALQA